jgi:hypothetical protein
MRNQVISASIFLCIAAIAMPAKAFQVATASESPIISESVTQIGASSWQYSFSITNMSNWLTSYPQYAAQYADSVKIVEYKLPYFSDANITSILDPSGWTHATVNQDSFSLGNGAQTLVWTVAPGSSGIAGAGVNFVDYPLVPGDTLGGFSYVATYAPVKGPYAAGFAAGYLIAGDPAIPGSPFARSAGLTIDMGYQVAAVPEPETYALMLAGLGLLGVAARRRKQKEVA